MLLQRCEGTVELQYVDLQQDLSQSDPTSSTVALLNVGGVQQYLNRFEVYVCF